MNSAVSTITILLSVAASCSHGGLPPGSLHKGYAILRGAKAYEGTPYSWGAGNFNGPTYGVCCSPSGRDSRKVMGFDCSGLTQYAVYKATGKKIPKYSADQATFIGCKKIPLKDRAIGDLIFWNGHVAIYAGYDRMVEASGTADKVVVNSKYRPKGAYPNVRRCW